MTEKRATRKSFEEALNSIGWSIKGVFDHNKTVINHLGRKTGWRVLSDRVELDRFGFDTPVVSFYFKDCYIEILEKTTVSLYANDGVFILFPNYDKEL